MVLHSKLEPGVSLHKDFTLQSDRVALLVIDVQEYVWLANTAHDHFCNTYDQGLEKINSLSKEFRRVRDDENTVQGGEVIFSYYQSLTTNRRDVSLDLKLSGDRFSMIPGPDSRNLFLDQCKPDKTFGKGDITLPKTSTSVFQSTSIDFVLRNLGVEQLVIAGLLTEQGVEAAARDAADLGYFVTVVQDACTAQSMKQHDSAISNMKQHARVLDTKDIIQELRLDFATKKAGAAGTSVLETSEAEKESAIAIVQYLRARGFDKAAETTESHFIRATANRYGVRSEAVGVPVAVRATMNDDTSERDHRMTSNNPVATVVEAQRQTEDHEGSEPNVQDFEGSPSSFLSIENDESSLHACAKLADESAATEKLQGKDRKMAPVGSSASKDEAGQSGMVNTLEGVVSDTDEIFDQSQASAAKPAAKEHNILSPMTHESLEGATEVARSTWADPESATLESPQASAEHSVKAQYDGSGQKNYEWSLGSGTAPVTTQTMASNKAQSPGELGNAGATSIEAMAAEASKETPTTTGLVEEETSYVASDKAAKLDSSADRGSMETASGASARIQFHKERNDRMDNHVRSGSSSNMSAASVRSRDPDGSTGREIVPPQERNASSFSNFGSSSSIPNVEIQAAPSSPRNGGGSASSPRNGGVSASSPRNGGVSAIVAPHPDVIPEEEESRGDAIGARIISRFRPKADPPANRFNSKSIIGDPTRKR